MMIMKCGCSANARNGYKQDCCSLHGTTEAMIPQPDLTGRVMKCGYCKKEEPSNSNGAFFIYKIGQEKDEFYCGCGGWD